MTPNDQAKAQHEHRDPRPKGTQKPDASPRQAWAALRAHSMPHGRGR